MLADALTLTYDSNSVTMTKIREGNFSSDYVGELSNMKLKLSVKHDIPPRGGSGESHLVRLDVEHYDTDGLYLRTSSAWTVIKTFDGPQDSTGSQNTIQCLQTFSASAAQQAKIIQGES